MATFEAFAGAPAVSWGHCRVAGLMLPRRSSDRAIGSTDRQRLAARPWTCSRYLRLCHQRHCADRGSNAFRRLVRGAGLVCCAGREFVRLPGNVSDGGIPDVVLRSLSRHSADEDENAGRVDEIREDCNEAWKRAMQVRPHRALSVRHYLHILVCNFTGKVREPHLVFDFSAESFAKHAKCRWNTCRVVGIG